MLLFLLLLTLVAGCNNSGFVPVTNAGEARGQIHTVSKGETLYAIAFRYGIDYREMAKANGIGPPYTIYVGQKLKIAKGTGPVADSKPTVDSTRPQPSKTTRPAPTQKAPAPVAKAPAPVIAAPRVNDSAINWQWPHSGPVVSGFGASGGLNKGIDIRGKKNDPVRASADGVVVYAGGGLRGYGKLVIIKHNDRFLSAYGHNETIRVQEGDSVRGGEVIATVGGNTSGQDLLHFEIRRDGKPEDPQAYLPRR